MITFLILDKIFLKMIYYCVLLRHTLIGPIYIYTHTLIINKKMLLLIAILKPNFINVISSFNECNIVFKNKYYYNNKVIKLIILKDFAHVCPKGTH